MCFVREKFNTFITYVIVRHRCSATVLQYIMYGIHNSQPTTAVYENLNLNLHFLTMLAVVLPAFESMFREHLI